MLFANAYYMTYVVVIVIPDCNFLYLLSFIVMSALKRNSSRSPMHLLLVVFDCRPMLWIAVFSTEVIEDQT